MILFILDNPLRVNTVVNLATNGFEPGTDEDLPSIKASKANIRALYESKLEFMIASDTPPKLRGLTFKTYDDGTDLYMPEYMPTRKNKPVTYSISFKKGRQLHYKSGVTEKGLEAAQASGVKLLTIMPEHGKKFKKAFIEKFDLKSVKDENFVYATFPKAKRKAKE